MFKTLFKTIKQALAIIGGLSSPSKMPCHGWSIPAKHCKTGQKLRAIVNSICFFCYALKGRYPFPNVQEALQKRLDCFLNNPLWVEAMSFVIWRKEKSGFFRWFDSGDIQSLDMLEKIVQIAKNLPEITFWLPTREYGFVSQYVAKHGAFPENLTVRLSAFMVDGKPPVELAKRLGCVTSGVSAESYTCPAPKQGNKCLDCRACWMKSVPNVNYKIH